MRRRLRPSRFGLRIALTPVAICLGTAAVVYVYVVAIGGAGSGDESVKTQIIAGGLIAAALALAVGIYYASVAASNVRRLQAAARKQFIANASHELRTPIFSLGGFVELLEEDDPSPAEREEFVRTMRQQIERLTKLTTDLLDLSQLDAGAMVMKAGSVDLGDLAREAAREFGPRAETHGSRLRLRTAERPVIALADRERVRQIIRILLDNALTHTPEGTEVSVTVNSSNRRRAELIVADQGPGIPQRVQGRIFERFYTGDSSGGSGLGLAIATELAQRMDGRMTINSSRRFTAFTLELPQARPAAVPSPRPLVKAPR
jgi:signal transduction histidine kinase